LRGLPEQRPILADEHRAQRRKRSSSHLPLELLWKDTDPSGKWLVLAIVSDAEMMADFDALHFALSCNPATKPPMDRDAAIAHIRKACNSISIELMKINPAVSALDDKEAQDEIYRTVFELTKEVETIKKRLAKLERSDESRDL
jgi:hypothetical protein